MNAGATQLGRIKSLHLQLLLWQEGECRARVTLQNDTASMGGRCYRVTAAGDLRTSVGKRALMAPSAISTAISTISRAPKRRFTRAANWWPLRSPSTFACVKRSDPGARRSLDSSAPAVHQNLI